MKNALKSKVRKLKRSGVSGLTILSPKEEKALSPEERRAYYAAFIEAHAKNKGEAGEPGSNTGHNIRGHGQPASAIFFRHNGRPARFG